MSEKDNLKKLNIGCGGDVLPGFINLDAQPYPHVDLKADLETLSTYPLRWFKQPNWPLVEDSYFDRMLMSHVFEHVTKVLPMMEELWRVAKPGCSLVIKCPYGSTDNADEDPTHVRRVFKDTFHYFSQAWYGKNSYNYHADWKYVRRQFILDSTMFDPESDPAQIGMAVATLRNVVTEFIVELVAVKPARRPGFQADEPATTFTFDKRLEQVSRLLVPDGTASSLPS